MRRIFLLFPVLAAAFCCHAQDVSYDISQRDIAVRDPFITVDRRAGLYYLVTTARDGQSMALQTYESPDLQHWRRLGLNYRGNEGWMQNVRNKVDHWWAPDTYLYRGRYYTILTLTSQAEGRINFCTLLRGGKKPQGTATTGETGIFEFDPVAKVGYKFTEGVQYKIIFARVVSNNWKEQTCSLFFTTDCFGHVAYSDGTDMENDVDSSKKSKTVYWRGIDPEENGPALCITSIGNVVGSCVEQGKTKYSLFEDFISEEKDEFGGKTGLENAIYYTVEQAKTKTEQKLIDDIGAALGLTKDDVAKAFTDNEVSTAWTAADSTLPAGQAAHTHTPGEAVQENVVPASCKAEGSYDEVVYCTECGEELSREAKTIDKLDHTPGEAVQENVVPATCTEDGSYDEVVYCTECGEELSRETKTIKTEGHKIVFVEEVPATASKDGVKAHYECTECHKLFSDAMGTVEVTAESLIIKAEHLRGDANMDGVVDTLDVTTIQRVLAEMEVENYDPIAADTDLDGIVDMIDVTLLQRVDVGMTTFEAWDAAHKAA